MASFVEIANSALTKLGAKRIMALTDNTKEAREINAIYLLRLNKLLRAYNWSFAMKRDQLSALSDTPSWGYTLQYQLPTDCVRVVQVNDLWDIPGLTNYMGGPDSEPYKIEGRTIVTDLAAPLKIRYVSRVTNPGQFDDGFVEAYAYDLAHEVCEALTQSNTKKQEMREGRKQEILDAIRSNAIELPPSGIPDDSWIMSRL